MKRRIHIVVASPSHVIRVGLSTIFKKMSSLGADVAEIPDMTDMPRRLRSIKPDVLVVDVSQLGALACQSLRADISMPSLKIVAMLSQMTDAAVIKNFDASISLYDSSDVIRDKIVRLMEEEVDESRQELSMREKEIICCVVKGMTNKQIADTLCLSAHTVMTHRRNIASKLSIHSTAGLTIYAIVNKLIELDEIKDSIYVGE